MTDEWQVSGIVICLTDSAVVLQGILWMLLITEAGNPYMRLQLATTLDVLNLFFRLVCVMSINHRSQHCI